MGRLQLGQVGCGGMGLRHVYGLIELRERGFDTFDLAAVCDLHQSAADHVAAVAEGGLGTRPRIYTNLDSMLESERGLDALNIVVDTRMHHTFALKAFDAGLHVAVEKPMGLTVSACRLLIDGARQSGKVLSISENYRRDPLNRLVKALLEAGVIGQPRMMISLTTESGGGRAKQSVGWKSLKLRGGMTLEFGVHTADLLLYFMGDVDRVSAETHLWERTRSIGEREGPIVNSYRHRVPEDFERAESMEATAEDTALAVLRFTSGAIGQLAYSDAAPGELLDTELIFGSEGSIGLPGSRTGRPMRLTMAEGRGPLDEEDVLAQVPDFHLDGVTSRFFDGKTRLASYEMPFEEIDRKLIAIELQDFADAVLSGRDPEVTGEVGLNAVALSYAILESGHLRQAVDFDDVVEDRTNAYQREINDSVGL